MSSIGPSQVYEIEYVEMLRTSCAEKDAEIARLTERVEELVRLHDEAHRALLDTAERLAEVEDARADDYEQRDKMRHEHEALRAKLAEVERESKEYADTMVAEMGEHSKTLADLTATRAVLDRYKAGMTDAMDALNSSAILLTRVVEAKHALAAALEEGA